MKILGSVTSPYVRKCRVVALEKKLDCAFEAVDVWSASGEAATQNPLAKVPVLLLDDGSIYDSRVIVEYLDGRAPTHRLIPDGNRERAEVRCLEALADGVSDAAIAAMLEKKFHPDAPSAVVIQRQMRKVEQGLAALALALGKNQTFNGRDVTLADIAVAVALDYLELRYPELTWKSQHPNLAEFLARMMERPSFVATPNRG